MRYLVTKHAYRDEFDDESSFNYTLLVDAESVEEAKTRAEEELSQGWYDVGYNESYNVTTVEVLLNCELNRVANLNELYLKETKTFYN